MLGAEHIFLISFNKRFSQLHANEFIQQVLTDGLGIKHLVTGNDFQFGHKRSGNAETLANAPFGYSAIEPVLIDGEPCSSTRIRNALKLPDLSKARDLLRARLSHDRARVAR